MCVCVTQSRFTFLSFPVILRREPSGRKEKPSEVLSERIHSWTVPFVNCLHGACSGAGCLPQPSLWLCVPNPLFPKLLQELSPQTSQGLKQTHWLWHFSPALWGSFRVSFVTWICSQGRSLLIRSDVLLWDVDIPFPSVSLWLSEVLTDCFFFQKPKLKVSFNHWAALLF